MAHFIYGLICGTFLGACSAFVYAMVRMPKQRSITMHARRDRHECERRRKYRDAETVDVPPPWERQETEPVEPIYMYGVTGCESD